MTDDPTPLSDMARRFAEEYLIDFNGSAAALRAGYAHGSTAYDLLKDPRVDALIREGKRRSSERVNVSIDSTLENFRVMTVVKASDFFYMKQAFVDVPGQMPAPAGDPYMALKPLDQWTDEMCAALKSIKHGPNGPEIVLHDKIAANFNIGKYLAMFVDRKEVSAPGGGPVQLVTTTMNVKEAAEAYASTLKASP